MKYDLKSQTKMSKIGAKLSLLITALFVISTIALAIALVFTLRSGYTQEVKTDQPLPPPSTSLNLGSALTIFKLQSELTERGLFQT